MSPFKTLVGKPIEACSACDGDGKLYKNALTGAVQCDVCSFILTSGDLAVGNLDKNRFLRIIDERTAEARRKWRELKQRREEDKRRREAEEDKVRRDEAKGKVKGRNKQKKSKWLLDEDRNSAFSAPTMVEQLTEAYSRGMVGAGRRFATATAEREGSNSELWSEIPGAIPDNSQPVNAKQEEDKTPAWSQPGKRKVDF